MYECRMIIDIVFMLWCPMIISVRIPISINLREQLNTL